MALIVVSLRRHVYHLVMVEMPSISGHFGDGSMVIDGSCWKITSRRTSGQTVQEKKSLVQRDQDAIQAPGGLATRFSGVMWAKPSRRDLQRDWGHAWCKRHWRGCIWRGERTWIYIPNRLCVNSFCFLFLEADWSSINVATGVQQPDLAWWCSPDRHWSGLWGPGAELTNKHAQRIWWYLT